MKQSVVAAWVNPIKVGLIGCGNIGTEVALFLACKPGFELTHLYDNNSQASLILYNKLKNKPNISEPTLMLDKCDLIVEAASKEAVEELLVLYSMRYHALPTLFISTGGIYQNITLYDAVNHGQFIIPGGAIGGLDVLSAVKEQITALQLITTKPASSLNNTIALTADEVVYEGDIAGAIEQFPKNINVAATLYLATRFNPINVKIIASPSAVFNQHQIACEGAFGRLDMRFTNQPSANPKTSALTLLSIKKALIDFLENSYLNQMQK